VESDPTKLIRDQIQAQTPRILTLKIKQGTKSGTLKKPMFSLFDVIVFLFNGMTKQNILRHDFQRTIFEIITSLE